MSVHYYVYAEIKVKGKWYNLNPYTKKHDGTMLIRPIYDACSSFTEIMNEMEDRATGHGIPDDMSPDLRSIFHDNLDEKCEDWYPEATWRQIFNRSIIRVNYSNTVGKHVIKDKPHKYEGYVSKRLIADFEVHEVDEIYEWLTQKEYDGLSDKEKRKYRYYQWDEPYDEYCVYRTIYDRLCAMMYWFDYGDAFENKREYYQNEPTIEDIRLFVERD